MLKETEYRIEHDSIGEKQIPKDVYCGVQTLRAVENFFTTGLKMYPEFINSFAQIKKAAAITNFEAGGLDKKCTDAIVQVYDEITPGKLHDEFIVDPIQGDAGTSFNVNVNEVITNRAIEIPGGEKGDYSVVNPDDHVNYGQSTNDMFPPCGKPITLKPPYKAQVELERLYHAPMEKSEEFNHVIKMGRTQFQDVAPIRLGQKFYAYATVIRRDTNRFGRVKEEMRYLNLGGAAIGTGSNADVKYLQRVVKNISLIPGLELTQAYDLIDVTQNPDGYIVCSGIAKSRMVNLSKMCNDLRFILSGLRTGLGEINLPAKQNGSSITLGKINPIIPEVVSQVAFHVIGDDMTIAVAAEAGQPELNASEPVIFHKLFQPAETIACAVHTLVDNCISGITANEQHCKDMVENSVGIITAICPYVGYEKAADVAKEAIRIGKSVGELAIRDKFLTKEQLDIILNLVSMAESGISGIEVMDKMGGL